MLSTKELVLLNCSVEDSESSLDCKEIQPVNSKEYQPWISIVRTDAKAEVPILWPPDVKSWLIGKDPGEKIEGRRRCGQQRTRCLEGITESMDMSLGKLLKLTMDREAWHAAVYHHKEWDMAEPLNSNNRVFSYPSM